MNYNGIDPIGIPRGEGAFLKLKEALDPLIREGSLIYLPEFWCCGSCGSYALSEEDQVPIENGAVLYFNEQEAASAGEDKSLGLILLPIRDNRIVWREDGNDFDELQKEELKRVGKTLSDRGYTETVKSPMELALDQGRNAWDFEFGTFDLAHGYLTIRDSFKFELPDDGEDWD